MQERVAAERERRRKESSAGLELPIFEVGDNVLYARMRRPGVTPKMMRRGLVRGGWLVLTIRISLRSRTLFLVAFTRRMLLACVSAPIRSSTSPQMSFWSRSHGACFSSAFLRRFAAPRHRRCQECVPARVQSGAISEGWCCPRGGSRRSFADRVGRPSWI